MLDLIHVGRTITEMYTAVQKVRSLEKPGPYEEVEEFEDMPVPEPEYEEADDDDWGEDEEYTEIPRIPASAAATRRVGAGGQSPWVYAVYFTLSASLIYLAVRY